MDASAPRVVRYRADLPYTVWLRQHPYGTYWVIRKG